jgi:DNA-binding GntR family transcriptional regulator
MKEKNPALETSVAERVADEIKDEIREGRLAPGTRLTEAQIGKQFGASRGPIREALRRLDSEGILTFEKNRGVSVRKLTRDDFVNLLEVREALEAVAARLLATNPRSERTVSELAKLFNKMQTAVKRGDVEQYNLSLYVMFHSQLVESSNNPVLIEHWHRLHLDVFRSQFRPLVDLHLVQIAHREHADLVAALQARDAKKAEQAVRQHIAHFTEHVRRLPDRVFRDTEFPRS